MWTLTTLKPFSAIRAKSLSTISRANRSSPFSSIWKVP